MLQIQRFAAIPHHSLRGDKAGSKIIKRKQKERICQPDERPGVRGGAARGELKHQARCSRNLYKGMRKIEIES